MSDDAVDKFFDEMVSPASTPTESTPPDEVDWQRCVGQVLRGRVPVR